MHPIPFPFLIPKKRAQWQLWTMIRVLIRFDINWILFSSKLQKYSTQGWGQSPRSDSCRHLIIINNWGSNRPPAVYRGVLFTNWITEPKWITPCCYRFTTQIRKRFSFTSAPNVFLFYLKTNSKTAVFC